MTNQQLAIQFFLQVAVILFACRALGWLARRIGQPRVIGEMVAGILLGPSLLGFVSPQMNAALFPRESLSVLSVVSQLGLALYMFVVGTHLRTDFIKHALGSAMLISAAGILAPFILGAALASAMHGDGRFFAAGVSPTQSMIYLGAAMSVTAFPVLARIIEDRGIGNTALGTLALAAGATDDVVAWCLLAIVLAGFNQNAGLAVWAIAGAAAYAITVLVVIRPWLARIAAGVEREGSLGAQQLALVLSMLMAAAWFTDRIGVHAVFGAFVLGVAIPRGVMTQELGRQVEPVASVLLVPLFFAYSGLSTHFNLLWSAELIGIAIGVIAIASVGKAVACWAAARATGRANPEAMAIGALMNARGLMELIILNIGLERGLITPMLFTIMVAMTLATTLAAGPLFERAWRSHAEIPDAVGARAH